MLGPVTDLILVSEPLGARELNCADRRDLVCTSRQPGRLTTSMPASDSSWSCHFADWGLNSCLTRRSRLEFGGGGGWGGRMETLTATDQSDKHRVS